MIRARVLATALVVVVGFLAGTFPSAEGADVGTPTGSSTSGGCLPPSLGVDLWMQGLPLSQGPEQTLADDCDFLCRGHVRKCTRIARISRTCNGNAVGAIAHQIGAMCATIGDGDERRACRRDTIQIRRSLRMCVRDDARWARGCCLNQNTLNYCLDNCLEDKGMPPDPCFGPGACLFDLFNNTFNSTLVN